MLEILDACWVDVFAASAACSRGRDQDALAIREDTGPIKPWLRRCHFNFFGFGSRFVEHFQNVIPVLCAIQVARLRDELNNLQIAHHESCRSAAIHTSISLEPTTDIEVADETRTTDDAKVRQQHSLQSAANAGARSESKYSYGPL